MSKDTKGPIHPASKTFRLFVICDTFTHFVVTKQIPLNDAETVADVILKQRNINFGPTKTFSHSHTKRIFNY